MGATSPIKAKVRYQDKVHNVGDKINVGIENFMTVIMIAIGYLEIFIQYLQQEIDASRSLVLLKDYWYIKRCIHICTCIYYVQPCHLIPRPFTPPFLITCWKEKVWGILSRDPWHNQHVVMPPLNRQVIYETYLPFCASCKIGKVKQSYIKRMKHTRLKAMWIT